MSAFDIYLVMQLDSIKIHVLSLFMLCLVLYVVFGLIGSLLKDQYITDHHPQDDRARKIQLYKMDKKYTYCLSNTFQYCHYCYY